MIKYSLRCSQEHQFEAWFASSSAYEKQAGMGQVHCPVCGTAEVKKALMAPNIVSGDRHETATKPASEESPYGEVVQIMRKLKDYVEANSEYVGPRFAEEA